MSKNKFYSRDEKKIIQFVKKNEILYNVRHKQFRDSGTKNGLWQELANELNAEVDDVKRKWTNMRDYFVRKQTQKSNGKPVTFTKRDKSMKFLLNTPFLHQYQAMPVVDSDLEESLFNGNEDDDSMIMYELDVPQFASINMSTTNTDSLCGGSSTELKTPKFKIKRQASSSTDSTQPLCELNQNPLDSMSVSKDNLDHFFESLASTMRTFPALSVAKLKLQMSLLVGEEEVALAKSNAQA